MSQTPLDAAIERRRNGWYSMAEREPPADHQLRLKDAELIADAYIKATANPPQPATRVTFMPEDAGNEELDWEAAIEQCDRIFDKCEEVPERGEDFAYSVMEKVESIRESIEKSERVTQGQLTALENMESGVDRWLH